MMKITVAREGEMNRITIRYTEEDMEHFDVPKGVNCHDLIDLLYRVKESTLKYYILSLLNSGLDPEYLGLTTDSEEPEETDLEFYQRHFGVNSMTETKEVRDTRLICQRCKGNWIVEVKEGFPPTIICPNCGEYTL